ncbi:peptidase M15-like protein [Yoonia maritima]|uniref:Peptidase M15-like protein n=1 Tax=Yoonia maritima TaxID=1435347 RepID=A0A2T0VTU3_9RHOB|nr:D-Ala-D-Ala carboxypeptidase family metallohydrolase [Yoonia maritima]PRY74764.1 peptidase M15-like protein [Yoonia maritima]
MTYKTNPLNPMLSADLDLFTFCQSDTAAEQGIYNLPQEVGVVENLTRLCQQVLQPAITHFDLPLFITSGYRCPRLNAEIGGLPDSQHLRGEAADIMMGGIANDTLALWLIDNTDFDELILEKFDPRCGEYGWVHVSCVAMGNRKKVSTFDGDAFHDGFHYFDLAGK